MSDGKFKVGIMETSPVQRKIKQVHPRYMSNKSNISPVYHHLAQLFLQMKTFAQVSITSCHSKSQSGPCALPARAGGPCPVRRADRSLTDTTIRDCYACLNPPSIIDYPQSESQRRGLGLLSGIQVRQPGRTDGLTGGPFSSRAVDSVRL